MLAGKRRGGALGHILLLREQKQAGVGGAGHQHHRTFRGGSFALQESKDR